MGVTKKTKVCPTCKGKGVRGIPDFIGSDEVVTWSECQRCEGTGKVGIKERKGNK